MDTLRAPAKVDREAFLARYARNRRRSLDLFDRVAPEAYESRPIPLRHPTVFYEGHLPAFSLSRLVELALGGPPVDPALEKLFERGIDPADPMAAATMAKSRWPSRAAVQAFGRACDAAVEDALAHAAIDVPGNPMLEQGRAAWLILEHEEMHHETYAYILHRMPYAHKRAPANYRPADDPVPPAQRRVEIPSGVATLGLRRDALPFAWDNEFEATVVDVPAFDCDAFPATNGDWLEFVRDGGPIPSFWLEDSGEFNLLGAWGVLPLPRSWPVWVTGEQARAYAAWAGRRVMTEAQYQRAAYGTPEGTERQQPWGDAEPGAAHGNFDWVSWDAEPVGSRPAGASAWGVHELVGNGWEHTSTPFGPLPGFAPHVLYPPYSSDFFDGKHYVVKGASPVTARELVRRSFRNWYYADYPFLFAKFRTVSA